MDKKTTNIFLGTLGAVLIAYLAFTTFSSNMKKGQVYYEPSANNVIEVKDVDLNDTVLNVNAIGQKIINTTGGKTTVMSPYLLANSLGAYIEGSTGNEQTKYIIGMNDNIKENMAFLNKKLKETTSQNSKTAIGLFMDKSVQPTDEFLDKIKYFDTHFETCDFDDFAKTKSIINTYGDKTIGIKELINNVYPKSGMIFITGMNFNSQFAGVFDSPKIAEGTFNNRQIPMIKANKAKVYLAEDSNGIYLKMPLENGLYYELYMPKGQIGDISLAQMNEYRDKAKQEAIGISMPNVEISQYNEFKSSLDSLGMGEAFGNPNLITPITKSAKLKIDKIDQNINIKIDVGSSTQIENTQKKNVEINKPYFYSVTDSATNCRIIIGKQF